MAPIPGQGLAVLRGLATHRDDRVGCGLLTLADDHRVRPWRARRDSVSAWSNRPPGAGIHRALREREKVVVTQFRSRLDAPGPRASRVRGVLGS
jgi:hypothetical protein